MIENAAIPLAALIVSLSTLTLAALGLRQKAGADYVHELEGRVRLLEASLKVCEREKVDLLRDKLEIQRENNRLTRDNTRLMAEFIEERRRRR